MEFEEDDGRDSRIGVCKTFLRENAVVDMLRKLVRELVSE